MKYFTIKELCRSTTADRKGIDNRCGCDIEANLTALVDNVLDRSEERRVGKECRSRWST